MMKYNKSSQSDTLDINWLKQQLLNKLVISNDVIREARKQRQHEIQDCKFNIKKFKQMLGSYELPEDNSFAVVLSSLIKLGQAQEAEALFELMDETIDIEIKDQVVGRYSYTAMLQALQVQIEQSSDEENRNTQLFKKFEKIVFMCGKKFYLDKKRESKRYLDDPYIANIIMCTYDSLGQYDQVEQYYERFIHQNKPDMPLYSKYITNFIKQKTQQKMDEAEKHLVHLVTMYRELKKNNKATYKDEHALRAVYNCLIIAHYPNHIEKALKLFKEATEYGCYANNQMEQIYDQEKQQHFVRLNLHLDKDYRKTEGGLSLVVSIVAFLNFIQQISEQHINWPAEVITGGHNQDQSKLKLELPKYLKETYGVDIVWDENVKKLVFTIPFEQLRKIQFIQDLLNGIELSDDLIQSYRSDLRRHNEKTPNKHYSDSPTIPEEFDAELRKLAKSSIDAFDNQNYREAETFRRRIIQRLPNHPWAYVQLGWVLHRTRRFEEAIQNYQQAVDLINKYRNDDNKSLSDVYRKIGWAYDRLHLKDKQEKYLDDACSYYDKAIQADTNNIETYNNWGITLYRRKQYDDAIQKFMKVITANDRHDESFWHLGNCYKQFGNGCTDSNKRDKMYDNAEYYYAEALKKSRQYAAKEEASAYILQEYGDLNLQRFKVDPSKALYFNLANLYFNDCIKLQRNRDQAYTGLGKLYQLNGQQDKAKYYFNLANEYLPKNIRQTQVFFSPDQTPQNNNSISSSQLEISNKSVEPNPSLINS